jgi:hypothetical protein
MTVLAALSRLESQKTRWLLDDLHRYLVIIFCSRLGLLGLPVDDDAHFGNPSIFDLDEIIAAGLYRSSGFNEFPVNSRKTMMGFSFTNFVKNEAGKLLVESIVELFEFRKTIGSPLRIDEMNMRIVDFFEEQFSLLGIEFIYRFEVFVQDLVY